MSAEPPTARPDAISSAPRNGPGAEAPSDGGDIRRVGAGANRGREPSAGDIRRVGAGWGRGLIAAYAFMALAAGARSIVQIATEFDAAPLAFTLSAASAAIYLLAAIALRGEGRRTWLIGTAACSVELAGVLAVGTWSLLDPARFPAATVWSGFGSGYGCFPLALPLLGLLYQRSRRPGQAAARRALSRRGSASC